MLRNHIIYLQHPPRRLERLSATYKIVTRRVCPQNESWQRTLHKTRNFSSSWSSFYIYLIDAQKHLQEVKQIRGFFSVSL
jgi:hypothetical protein